MLKDIQSKTVFNFLFFMLFSGAVLADFEWNRKSPPDPPAKTSGLDDASTQSDPYSGSGIINPPYEREISYAESGYINVRDKPIKNVLSLIFPGYTIDIRDPKIASREVSIVGTAKPVFLLEDIMGTKKFDDVESWVYGAPLSLIVLDFKENNNGED